MPSRLNDCYVDRMTTGRSWPTAACRAGKFRPVAAIEILGKLSFNASHHRQQRAVLLAVREHVIVGQLSISAETLMAQVDQISSIPDSSVRLTSVSPRVEKFESLGVSENQLQ